MSGHQAEPQRYDRSGLLGNRYESDGRISARPSQLNRYSITVRPRARQEHEEDLQIQSVQREY